MKIKWKRVVIAGFLTQLLLFIPAPQPINWIISFIAMLLGGLLASWNLHSKFILHGALVGVVANVLWLVLVLMAYLNGKLPPDFSVIVTIIVIVIKVFVTGLGGYVAGKMSKSNREEISN